MPVWWGTFAYAMVISIIGMVFYKNKRQSATLESVEDGKIEQYKSIGLVFAIASFALLVFFAGNRSVIHDTQEYQYHYDLFYTGDLNEITEILNGTKENVKGPIFYIFLVLFKHFTNGSYNDWFMSLAIIQAISLAIFLCKYSVNFSYSIFLFFTTNGFIWMVNGIRQFLAVTIVLLFSDFIFKRKTIPFIIVVLFVFFIHSASIMWLPVYFLINFKPWSKKFMIFTIVLTFGIVLFSRSSFLNETEFSYLTSDPNTGINPFRVAVFSVPAIIAFIRRKEINEKSNQVVNTMINISVICAACYVAGWFSNGVVARMAAYYNPFLYILMPWLLKNSFNESMGKTITLVSMIGFFVYFCFEVYMAHNGIYYSDVLGIYLIS